jgi:hypothetical protein
MGGSQSNKYYTGEFNCSVSIFNQENEQYEEIKNAQDYLLEADPFAFEIISEFIEKHVVDFINQNIENSHSHSGQILLGYGFGGDHGDGDGHFCVPFRLTEIPPMYFEMVQTKRNAFKLIREPIVTLYGKETETDVLSEFVMNFSVELKRVESK